MAQPPPPPQPWFPAPAPRTYPEPAIIGVIIVLVAFVFFGIVVALVGGNFSIFPSAIFLGFLCIPVLIGIVFAVIALSGAASRRAIPPPPPIQQPMVRAGQQAPIALDCPNCGGPPTNVDRFGIATCSYCGTRYLVR